MWLLIHAGVKVNPCYTGSSFIEFLLFKHCLPLTPHVHIWQAVPQLSRIDMPDMNGVQQFDIYICKIRIAPIGKVKNLTFVTPPLLFKCQNIFSFMVINSWITSIYTTGKKYGIFFISPIFFFLWSVQRVSVVEIHSYEQISLLGELIST